MGTTENIFLTGATGLLGRYLLRDFLDAGYPVTVLVRDSGGTTSVDRVRELTDFWSASLGRDLPQPTVLNGDLTQASLGLGASELGWLKRQAPAVVHAAACVSHQATADGEPWETNVHGTRRLLEICRTVGLPEVHQVSTAFVCGDRQGVVREDELDCGAGSDNAYEQSKFAAEELFRQFPDIRATVYRPSVIVGDSRTGYTSTYHHFYRFLELAVRLSAPASRQAQGARRSDSTRQRRRRLALRLPLTGEEMQNLVPVDWVAQALVQLVQRPMWHGHTFHLVAREGVRLNAIKVVIEELLSLEGIQWAGTELLDPTPLEERVVEHLRVYWPYLHSNLVFDCHNISLALPELPPPRFDRDLLERLLNFALEDGWGQKVGTAPPADDGAVESGLDCAEYLEKVVSEQTRYSLLVKTLPPHFVFCLDISGRGGGQWLCSRGDDGLLQIRRGFDPKVPVIYRTDAATFRALIDRRQTTQKAFFDGCIELEGDMEKALKLAALIEQFLAQHRPAPSSEVRRASPCH